MPPLHDRTPACHRNNTSMMPWKAPQHPAQVLRRALLLAGLCSHTTSISPMERIHLAVLPLRCLLLQLPGNRLHTHTHLSLWESPKLPHMPKRAYTQHPHTYMQPPTFVDPRLGGPCSLRHAAPADYATRSKPCKPSATSVECTHMQSSSAAIFSAAPGDTVCSFAAGPGFVNTPGLIREGMSRKVSVARAGCRCAMQLTAATC